MLKTLQDRRAANEDGFTLIELLIVIVILGILAAIVVFSVAGVTSKGTASACKSDVKAVDVAAEAMYAQTGSGVTQTGIGALVTGGFLHPDSNFTTASGTTVVIPPPPATALYTITFTPGTLTAAGAADTTTCPAT